MRRRSLVLSALALAGCGYRPLYGTSSQDHGVVAELAAVSIPEAQSRLGQIVRNDLLSTMRPAGTVAEDRYTLRLDAELKTADIIDKPLPATTRKQAQLSVAYELTEAGGETAILSGKAFSQVSYDLVRQPFADMQAETNAIERAAHEASADIRARLAAHFAKR